MSPLLIWTTVSCATWQDHDWCDEHVSAITAASWTPTVESAVLLFWCQCK